MIRAQRLLAAICALALVVVIGSVDAWAAPGNPGAVSSSPRPQAEADSLQEPRPLGTANLADRPPPEDRLREYREDDAYDYAQEDPPASSADTDSAIWSALEDFFSGVLGSPTGRQVMKWVVYGIAAGLVGYGLLALIRMEPTAKRRRRSRSAYSDEGLDRRVPETNFRTLIREAREAGDHRSVLRLHYLLGLQILNENDWIQWRPERTNHHYERMLRGTVLGEPFREATRTFDIVWYGDVQIDEGDLSRLLAPFETVIDRAASAPSGAGEPATAATREQTDDPTAGDGAAGGART
jgi:hypothetical protein